MRITEGLNKSCVYMHEGIYDRVYIYLKNQGLSRVYVATSQKLTE